MKNVLFAGATALAMTVAAPVMAASDSFAGKVTAGKPVDLGGVFQGRKGGGGHGPMPGGMHVPGTMTGPGMGGQYRWGHRMGGRWFAGFYAPGGWGGYRAPVRGYVLPSYWINSSYRIVNYPLYGLYAPQTGYGWSRYYDDAVLMDNRGYVQDYRSNIPWDRYEGGYAPGDYAQPEYGPAMGADRGVYYGDDRVYSDSGYPDTMQAPQIEYRAGTGEQSYTPPAGAPYATGGYPPPPPPMAASPYRSRYGFERYEQCLQNRGVTGGVLGAVVGAVIGNRVAGRGDRLAGSLIGGGIGAIAGVSIEKATNKCRKYLPREDYYYYGSGNGSGGYPGGYYPPQPQPVPAPQPYPYGYQTGYYYPQPAPVVTTIMVSPAVTTTTTTTEEVYYETVTVPAKKVVRKWKPRPKPRCTCR